MLFGPFVLGPARVLLSGRWLIVPGRAGQGPFKFVPGWALYRAKKTCLGLAHRPRAKWKTIPAHYFHC